MWKGKEDVLGQIVSDLYDQAIMSNLVRRVYVERMIGVLLGSEWEVVSGEWLGWDLQCRRGPLAGTKVEVKQSAARQVWSDRPSLKGRHTNGSFSIAPTKGYYADRGRRFVKSRGRHAHLYVFAWHPIPDKSADHRDPSQWEFYVVRKSRLPPGQKTASLGKVKKWAESEEPVKHNELRAHVLGLLAGPKRVRIRTKA